MPKKPFNWWLWTKCLVASGVVIWGGPALVRYVQPTEEELFQRYNPELQKRSLEGRLQREQEFDEFVRKLKEYAKSDKPIWIVQAEAEKEKERRAKAEAALELAEEVKARRDAIRREAGLPVESECVQKQDQAFTRQPACMYLGAMACMICEKRIRYQRREIRTSSHRLSEARGSGGLGLEGWGIAKLDRECQQRRPGKFVVDPDIEFQSRQGESSGPAHTISPTTTLTVSDITGLSHFPRQFRGQNNHQLIDFRSSPHRSRPSDQVSRPPAEHLPPNNLQHSPTWRTFRKGSRSSVLLLALILTSAATDSGKGTPRRKVKRAPARSAGDDKKLQQTLKKLNVQPIQAIEEVNMFKSDGNVIHFSAPKVHAAVPANTFAIYGNGEEKELTELVPGILNQLGPDSLASLRKLAESFQNMQKPEKEADDDEIPDLVAGENFENKVE
ncbi:hypothetical protein VTJ04DRAFT_7539 [Mycothermus thermophilus]|uniref:uncharacterized protein n=1 Tax=Humicola insolens TaxID=85995 RepID=UPI003742D982